VPHDWQRTDHDEALRCGVVRTVRDQAAGAAASVGTDSRRLLVTWCKSVCPSSQRRNLEQLESRRPSTDAGLPELGSLPNVPRRTHREDSFIAAGKKHPFQKPATLIVEEVFVPFVFHKLGYNHNYAAIGMLFRKVQNKLDDRNDNEAVG
jgi:hypothetical protein